MTVSRIQLTGSGPEFSRLVAGVWRLGEWGMDTRALLGFIHGCLDLGITTFDNADIYGGYTCERLFGAALAAEPGAARPAGAGDQVWHPTRDGQPTGQPRPPLRHQP
jgi:predicted oxidoreductase